ncbi:hypothetical protein DB30_05189 [Enhygromyxa salina]|uniref:Uncharacterized protein n=1 Tax=Enhygromyxa salina TaxID=215803 RepID=A0A0C2D775_9BACT|nr:hypothetical protein [Enhygromyxa salina]KIG15882.1 hypothetical protein DB30_05189 [Enhygromyxa salina]
MQRIVDILLLGLPVMVVFLLLGLGLCIAVLVKEGQGRAARASQIVGLINLGLVVPLSGLSWAADLGGARLMFMFSAGAFALVGLLGLRLPLRFRD